MAWWNRCQYQHAITSETGPIRQVNEDSVGICAAGQCFALADGVGGADKGDVASQFVVDGMLSAYQGIITSDHNEIDKTIAEHLQAIHQQLSTMATSQQLRMATTIVSGYLCGTTLHYLHVGDSRLYLFRNGALALLTKDDSLRQQMLDRYPTRQQEIKTTVNRNIITQAIGVDDIDIHQASISIKAKDVILCSSDGAHEYLSLEQMEKHLRSKKSLQKKSQALVTQAIAQGSNDNTSILLIKIPSTALSAVVSYLTQLV